MKQGVILVKKNYAAIFCTLVRNGYNLALSSGARDTKVKADLLNYSLCP